MRINTVLVTRATAVTENARRCTNLNVSRQAAMSSVFVHIRVIKGNMKADFHIAVKKKEHTK